MTRQEWLLNLVERGDAAKRLQADPDFSGLLMYLDDQWKVAWLNAGSVEERERMHARMTGLRDIIQEVLPALIHEGEQASDELNGTQNTNDHEEEINAP